MSSSRIAEALAELGQDVAKLRLASPAAIRARGEAARRRQVMTVVATVAAGAVVTGVVVLPVVRNGWPGQAPAASPTTTATLGGCEALGSGPAGNHPPSRWPLPSDNPALVRSRLVRVFLTESHTAADWGVIEARLRGLPEVVSVDFVDHEEAYREFKRQFCDAPDLIAATRPESLPEWFTVMLRAPSDFPAVQHALTYLSGIAEVVHVPQ